MGRLAEPSSRGSTGRPKRFSPFTSATSSIRSADFTTSTMSGDRRRPATAPEERRRATSSRRRESFTPISIAHLMGRPGADVIVDHGMDFLWNGHRDAETRRILLGRWLRGAFGQRQTGLRPRFRPSRRLERESRRTSGRRSPARRRLDRHPGPVLGGAVRGGRGGVHEGLARLRFLSWPELQHASDRSADGGFRGDGRLRPIFAWPSESPSASSAQNAAANDWRLPEHFTSDWRVNKEYAGSPMFRPYGTTPGHSLEWSRLLLQLWELGGRRLDWLPDASKSLFARATV